MSKNYLKLISLHIGTLIVVVHSKISKIWYDHGDDMVEFYSIVICLHSTTVFWAGKT